MNLISANATHKPQLMNLWRQCFDADDRYLELAFGRPYPLCDTKLLMQGDRVAAALSLLACEWSDGTTSRSGYYIYGVGTLPEFRRQGLSTRLMHETLEHLRQKKAEFAILMPAQRSLFSFYQKQGFLPCSFVSMRGLEAEQQHALADAAMQLRRSEGWSLEPLSRAQQYDTLRRSLLHAKPSILWEERHYAYCDREAAYYGGHLFLLRHKGEAVGCAACWPQEHEGKKRMIVKELLCPQQEQQAALSLLAELAGKRPLVLRLPAWEPGEPRPCGMIRWLCREQPSLEQQAYLALTLD